MSFITGLLARFSEPSSWAGLAALLASALSVPVDSPLVKSGILVASGIAGGLAFFLKEKGNKTTPPAA